MLGCKESYQGGPQNMMPPKRLPPGQTQWEVNWIPTAPPNTWGGGKWQYPSAHWPFTPIKPTLHQQEGDQPHQQNIITPKKTISQTSTMIQLHPPSEWMTKTYYQTTEDPTIINTRHFQSKGTNWEISLLISMVAQKMSTHEPNRDTNRIIGTALQYHSTSTLIKALKHKTSLQNLHYKISTKHYPVPTEKELCPTTIPTLFQNN